MLAESKDTELLPERLMWHEVSCQAWQLGLGALGGNASRMVLDCAKQRLVFVLDQCLVRVFYTLRDTFL